MTTLSDIRPSPIAGRWYPANPRKLAESVDHYIQTARIPEIKGEILALVSPHAGHLYSGPVAGYAFKSIVGLQPELVVILSPYHQYHHPGRILTSGHQAYQTPLGEIPVDRESIEFISRSLQEKNGVDLSEIRNDGEHAVEILLPFFQRTLQSKYTLLPLMLRQQEAALMHSLGEILGELMLSRDALLVASTDLSHFQTATIANQLDQTLFRALSH
jgi:MEMO1 family protein